MRLRRNRPPADLQFLYSVIDASRDETRLARSAIQQDIADLRADVAKVLELLETLAKERAA